MLHTVNEMEQKLKSYYTAATQYVFSEVCLLDPTTKTSLFEFGSFTEDAVNWQQQYTHPARERFRENYAGLDISDDGGGEASTSVVPAKRR